MKHIFKGMSNESIDVINNNFDELDDPKRNQTVNDLTVKGQIIVNPGQKVYHTKVTLQPNLEIDLYRVGNIVLARFGGRGVTISSWTAFDGKIPLGYRTASFTSAIFSVDANIHTVNIWEDGGVYNRYRDGNDSGGAFHDADGSSIWFTKDDYPE